MSHRNHYFHLVNYRAWPLTGAIGAILVLIRIAKLYHLNNRKFLIIIGLVVVLLTIFQWWRDVSRERTFQGLHTKKVLVGLKLGIILFIISEIFFFISFFWAFFHSRLSPTIELGLCWPPRGVDRFDPFKIPLLNTIILLSSGITITWAHHRLLTNNFKQMNNSLLITVILGVYFSFLQIYEYADSRFSISDSCYGSTFFIATGFHGLHVLVGTTFLLVCYIRHLNSHFSIHHHFGVEASAWYWHFVDVVWLFLFVAIYWWGN